MSTKVYNKLVRDRIPEIIQADGQESTTRVLDDKEHLRELVKKLDEEIAEFKADLSLEELADMQEIILALADIIANREEFEKVRARKAELHGAFKDRIFLEKVKDSRGLYMDDQL